MQITFAQIHTSLLHTSDACEIYDLFFSKCEKIKSFNSSMNQEERDRFFSRVCSSIRDPEHYLFLIRSVRSLVRRSIITKKPSLSKFFKGFNLIFQFHRGRSERKRWRCNHVWNLYQHIKIHGIIEPLSVVYEKKQRDALLDAVIMAIRKFLLLKPTVGYEYSVRIGSSRLWVAKKLGIEKIKCIVFDPSDTNSANGQKITLDEIQSYFASPVKISEIKTSRKHYYLVNPRHFHLEESGDNKLHWADGCI